MKFITTTMLIFATLFITSCVQEDGPEPDIIMEQDFGFDAGPVGEEVPSIELNDRVFEVGKTYSAEEAGPELVAMFKKHVEENKSRAGARNAVTIVKFTNHCPDNCTALGAELQGKKPSGTWVQVDAAPWNGFGGPYADMAYGNANPKGLADVQISGRWYHNFKHLNFNENGQLWIAYVIVNQDWSSQWIDVDATIVTGYCRTTYFRSFADTEWPNLPLSGSGNEGAIQMLNQVPGCN